MTHYVVGSVEYDLIYSSHSTLCAVCVRSRSSQMLFTILQIKMWRDISILFIYKGNFPYWYETFTPNIQCLHKCPFSDHLNHVVMNCILRHIMKARLSYMGYFFKTKWSLQCCLLCRYLVKNKLPTLAVSKFTTGVKKAGEVYYL